MAQALLYSFGALKKIQKNLIVIRTNKMKTFQRNLLSLAAATLAATTLPAAASLITVTSFSQPNPVTVRIQSTTPSTGLYVYAGGFNTTDGTNSFVSWCVDILQSTYFGSPANDYTLVNAAAVSHIGAARADALGALATQYLGSVNNASTSAAFQLAVWEIVYETAGAGYNLNSGNFSAWGASDGSLGLAQGWLSNLPGTSTHTASVWQSPTRQDLAVFTTVPEPATFGLLAAGLCGLAFVRRRRAVTA